MENGMNLYGAFLVILQAYSTNCIHIQGEAGIEPTKFPLQADYLVSHSPQMNFTNSLQMDDGCIDTLYHY